LTKNDIITRFFLSKEFNDAINKMEPDYLRDDLKSEVMLVLCQEDEHFLQELYYREELKYWVVRIILNMVKSQTSPFYNKYRIGTVELGELEIVDSDINDRLNKELLQEQALKEIDGLDWYEAGLINLYLKLGNYRAIEAETRIPRQSIYRTIKAACKKINKKVHEQY